MIATALILLVVLIGLSIPIAASLGVLGLLLDKAFGFLPLTRAAGEITWNATTPARANQSFLFEKNC